MSWFVMAWTRATEFSGRSRRKEYWMFTLINSLIGFALMLLPSWSCSVRRLHDTGRSGWWLLLYLVPGIGLIVLVFLMFDSQPGRNEYGPNPKSPQQPAWAG